MIFVSSEEGFMSVLIFAKVSIDVELHIQQWYQLKAPSTENVGRGARTLPSTLHGYRSAEACF